MTSKLNISKIKEIVNSNTNEEIKTCLIYEVLAEQENSSDVIITILNKQRNKSKELSKDLNLQLSKYLVKTEGDTETEFIRENIRKIYQEHNIRSCFVTKDFE